MNVSTRHLALFAAALFVVVVCAYGIGKVAASYFDDDAKRLYLSARGYASDELVSGMNTIVVGGLIPDHAFQLMNGDTVQLSRMLSARTFLIFLDPTCPTCLGQAELIVRLAQTVEEQRHFLFLTKADQGQLDQLAADLRITIPILIDSGGIYHDALNVHSSPFSVLVDTNLMIKQIVAGELLEDEIIEIAKYD